MKHYVVNCDSVTGVQGQNLFKGMIYPEIVFMNLNDHIESGDISEIAEETE